MPRMSSAEREAIAERKRRIANTCFFIAAIFFMVFWFNLMKAEPNAVAAYGCLAGSLLTAGFGFTRARLIGVLVILILVVGTVSIFVYRSGTNSIQDLTRALRQQAESLAKQTEIVTKDCSIVSFGMENGVPIVTTCRGKMAISNDPNNGKNLKQGEIPSYGLVLVPLTGSGLIPVTDPKQIQAGEPTVRELTISLPQGKSKGKGASQ